jgi:glycosyltransferase involved in cell wall biosynthesis
VKISVVTPSLNGARYLEQAIRSVLDQETSAEIQYVVMDGGSTDGTVEILRKYGDRILWRSEKDKYHSDALNKGFALCDGDVVAWINTDDFYEPGAFETARRTFEAHPEALWMAGFYRMTDENGADTRSLHARYKHFLMRHYSYWLLVSQNVFAQPSVFMRRSVLEKALPLDCESPNRPAFDYELWLRLGKMGRPAIVPKVLSCFRWHKASVSGRQTAALFNGELEYAKKEFGTHPTAVLLHYLNWMGIRLTYTWWKW